MPADNVTEAPLNPGLVFEMVNAHQKTAALNAAIELDVFRAVGDGPGDAASIAQALRVFGAWHPHPVRFLVINGILTKENGHYKHTPSSAAFLDPRSPACMASVAQFMSNPGMLRVLRASDRGGAQRANASAGHWNSRAGESDLGGVCREDGSDDGTDGCTAGRGCDGRT